MKNCENCGKGYKLHFKDSKRKFCTEKCAFEAHNKRKIKNGICLRCPEKIRNINPDTGELFKTCKNCRDKRKKNRKKEYQKNKQSYINRANKSYQKNKNIISKKNRKDRAYYKEKLFEIFGKCCKHCGLKDLGLLTIDHIHGDGAEHRKRASNSLKILKEVVESEDKTKYRILCMNCNWCLGQYGYLPILDCVYEDIREG